MIVCGSLLCVLSAAFFVLWQYLDSPWLILGYILALLSVCGVYFVMEKRKQDRILDRFAQILRNGSADYNEELAQTTSRRIRIEDGSIVSDSGVAG